MYIKTILVVLIIGTISTLSFIVHIRGLEIENLNQHLTFQQASYENRLADMNSKVEELNNRVPEIVYKYETVVIKDNATCEDKIKNIDELLNVFKRG